MSSNKQIDFWQSDFGREYSLRNSSSFEEWNNYYLKNWGLNKIEMNNDFLSNLDKEIRILEVGSNTGMQLAGLQQMGFKNLFGIEIQPFAVELSKKYSQNINIINGSGFDIPFKDNYFDLVFTSGVLIHIAPENLPKIISEIYRTSKKYIWGFEYFAPQITDIIYRGNSGYLWKADYPKLFIDSYPDLKEVKTKFYKYLENENVDQMYLLSK